MKHIKGPWKAGEIIENDFEPRHIVIRGQNGIKMIAKAIYGQTDKEREDNAHLIAAAPELLEALKFIVEYVDDQGEWSHLDAFKQANKAINKAEGR
ncbi:hypothetical protein KAR91_24515 [Candidatus Pacearchaeota archaeon]|nr:hypothetical protein [Candidatus Pacearchaeota archaeon]